MALSFTTICLRDTFEDPTSQGVAHPPRFLSMRACFVAQNHLDRRLRSPPWAAPASAQQSSPERGIRIITPYSEHVYSADPAAPQQLLDDEALRQQNEEGWRQFQMDTARRRLQEMDGD
jgi:hypothetical protein